MRVPINIPQPGIYRMKSIQFCFCLKPYNYNHLKNILLTLFVNSSRLRSELATLRRRGVTKVTTGVTGAGSGGNGSGEGWAPDPGRSCGRCKAELGRIINRGAICR